MTEKHLRYFYEIEYLGKERSTGNTVERRAIVESSDISPQDFAFQLLETAKPIVAELDAVVTALHNNLPSDIESVQDYTIERKDEFEEMFGIIKTVPRLICKWTSYQTFTLTPKQEEVFKFIENQLMTISMKWGEWKKLFGPPYGNLSIMQETAPTFFSITREALMHEVMLSIRRLFDLEKMSGNENCTFEWLSKNLDQGNKRSEFEQALQHLKPKTAFLNTWRHKVLAHWVGGLKGVADATSELILRHAQDDGILSENLAYSCPSCFSGLKLATVVDRRYREGDGRRAPLPAPHTASQNSMTAVT
jgi:hypothetical protein